MKFKIIIIAIIIILLTTGGIINGAELQNYFFQTSLYTLHYSNKDYQNNSQNLIGFERHYTNQSLDGIAFFKNTYQQNTIFIYRGHNYYLTSTPKIQVTAKFIYGIISGYDDENGRYNTWMHKMETFPALLFGLGLKKGAYRLDIIPFADAGIIITGGIEF